MEASLSENVEQLTVYIRELCPEARVEVSDDIFETEDANVVVYPPLSWDNEQVAELQHQLSERSLETLVETGYHILVYVYERQQQIAEAVRQQQTAAQQMEQAAQLQREAECVLQEAARLHLADAPLPR